MNENIDIAELESKLMGEWICDDNSITYNFFSTAMLDETGQLDVTQNDNFSSVLYKLFISDGKPHFKIIDEANNNESVYAFDIIEGEQRVLKLVNTSGETMNFLKQ